MRFFKKLGAIFYVELEGDGREEKGGDELGVGTIVPTRAYIWD